MTRFRLFPRELVIGVFRGFSEGGLEFHADLVLPYRSEFQSIPMHGQFLLVQLETEDEAVLGRITSLSSSGKLASGVGEEFNVRAMQEERSVPEDLREKYLKYRVDIRVLGVLRQNGTELHFLPSHRRLPHVGSPVAFLDGEVLREVVGHYQQAEPIGHFALGEFIYCGDSPHAEIEPGMQIKEPEVMVKFPVHHLVSRRTFIFARAGFGKSNLNKLLFSELYRETPTVEKRQGVQAPVGTLLFDPDGEYFWPDDKGRPGLCDVPHLQDMLVVFTNRHNPSLFYQSFVAGGIRLDIRRLRPADVISIAISPEKQDQQNIVKLRGLSMDGWSRLVDLIYRDGNQTDENEIASIIHVPEGSVEAIAARSHMTHIVRMLHDPSSTFIDTLFESLSAGKLCVIDISQMRGNQGLILSGILLRKIFDHNQEEFTKAHPKTIPTIAVVEEAQSVLNERASGSGPYIEWVKEGRKYDLGAVLITQQPASIANEILSQGDNWFVFHLLSAGDLQSIKKANAHFSSDILSTLLNEPIMGQGVFWSSATKKPYPIGLRVLSFEKKYSMIDRDYGKPAADTYAATVKKQHQITADPETGEIDLLSLFHSNAVERLQTDSSIRDRLKSGGMPWGALNGILKECIPEGITEDIQELAYREVKPAMDAAFGPQNQCWETFKNETTGKTWIRLVNQHC
ncbi:MAG TPA: DUF87 domain-containing protein [Rhodobacteraceae bacterium]|nr:DUF87 domain-containing protein [Paracoccaceae bacterium]